MNFYFFDLETSGFRAREDRIMQFAGQRTDMDLKPIGEPDNILVKLSDDVLPQPDAVLVHGITPQKTRAEGLSEAEFAKYLTAQVFTPDTIAVGYNNIRFDNEFMRFLFWRNFTDAYEWAWKNGCSTWDLLDAARMTRALRPDGIKWPFASDGQPSNKLELLASINNLEHVNAHDALSDVNATIELARLIKAKQPKLFDYLLKNRSKNKIAPLVTTAEPLIYTSGRYPSDWEKTTVVSMVAMHPDKNAALVYDLRIDPDEFTNLTPVELARAWQNRGDEAPYFPVKILTYNRCPAVAPYSTLDSASEKRLKLHKKIIENHFAKLQSHEDFGDKLIAVLEIMNKKYKDQQSLVVDELKVDSALYDGFVNDADRSKMSVVRAADANKLSDLSLDFADDRLKYLLPLYKARNFPSSLNADEQKSWRNFRNKKLMAGGENSLTANYFKRLSELSASAGLTRQSKYLLEELQLWGEAVVEPE